MGVLRFSLGFVLAIYGGPSEAAAPDALRVPAFTALAGAVRSQAVSSPKAALVYWDQAAADALAIPTPPGRVGLPSFSEWAKRTFGREVREGSPKLNLQDLAGSTEAEPVYFIEKDAAGGSGRAGYLHVSENSWVNIKGIGITGFGRTKQMPPGPPSSAFSSHADGSATLAEAIKEAIYSRVADNETSRGGSRVIGILATGRTLHFADGGTAPEALIIRAPMKRADQARDTMAIVDSLAELNAKRLMKGDFVNASNMGSSGQLVDFGCLTHTCDYVEASSSQGVKFLQEHYIELWPELKGSEQRFRGSFGRYLANQLGIPDAYLAQISSERLARFSMPLRAFVRSEETTLVDFAALPPEALRSRSGAIRWMPLMAAEYFREPTQSRAAFVAKLSKLQGDVPAPRPPGKPNPFKEWGEMFFGEAYDLFREIRLRHPETREKAFADAIEKVARFKLREVPELVRPELSRRANEIASNFAQQENGAVIQEFIDDVIHRNRLTTGPVADGLVRFAADERETRIYIRAATSEEGKATLFSHPDLPGGSIARGDQHFFRLSTDGWKSHADFPAALITTDGRAEFLIRVPHEGALPVTTEPLRFSPFWKNQDLETKWPTAGEFSLTAPPLFLNERLGLKRDLARVPDAMLKDYGIRVRPELPPSVPAAAPPQACPAFFSYLFSVR